jgi:hypothetical protein
VFANKFRIARPSPALRDRDKIAQRFSAG